MYFNYFLSCSSMSNRTTGDLTGQCRPEEDRPVSPFSCLPASVTPICKKDAVIWTMLTARSHPGELWWKLTNPLIGHLQLTLEQPKFDLLGSTYMRTFFNSECSVVSDQPHGPVAPQVPLSMEFSRQEYWSGLPFPSPFSNSKDYKTTWFEVG